MQPSKRSLFVVSVLIIVIAVAIKSLSKWLYSIDGIIEDPLLKYDYIIVGGGTAGCVVARRLWERSNCSVLVVEAGSVAPWMTAVPLLAPALQNTSVDWAFMTTPQKYSMKGLNNKQSAWPRGKSLGGSGVLNYLLHMWGARSDFDSLWNFGDSEWSFDSVHKYFKKIENYKNVLQDDLSEVRGRQGPMPVTDLDISSSPLSAAFMDGVRQLNIGVGDLNGQLENGAMVAQSNVWHGWRMSSFDTYLKPILKTSKIHLLTNTMAIKLIIEKKKAVGLLMVNTLSRKTHQVKATKEIIVSAGVVGSPHLLMLSGIGPKPHLQKHNIAVLSDLPGVGGNLRDHVNVPLYFHVDAPVTTTTKKIRSLSNVWKYLTKGTGSLAQTGVESVVRLPAAEKGNSKLFFMLFNLGSVNEDLFTSISNFERTSFRETFPDTKNDSKEGFLLLASCTQPLSTGRISLSSANPFDPPIIDPNYLHRIEDIKCLIKAIKKGAQLATTKPMRKLGARLHLPGYPSCSTHNQSLEDEAYLECWIRMAAITAYHPVGSCAMGLLTSSSSVLDQHLRVRGIKSLRVVDSSVFPHHVSGNPNAAVLMVAEKAVDLILDKEKSQH